MSCDLVSQAVAALRQKNFAVARDCIAAYATDHKLDLQHYLIKGLAELSLKDWRAAEATFTAATGFFPHQAQLWLNCGMAEENLGLLDKAAASYERCLDLHPQQGEACGNISNIYRRQGRFREAETMARRAYEFGAPKAQALNTLGLVLARQGRFDAAEQAFNEAYELAPDDADIIANLANLAVDQLNFTKAWPLFAAARKADADDPIIRRDEAMARLLFGDFEHGWPLYEARLELPDALRVHSTCPRWQGESLTGKKLLLVAEQGFGDTIQFCRYGRLLADMGAVLIWVVRQPLQRLLASNLPGMVICETDALPNADYWLPLLSLPFVLMKYQPSDISSASYLKAPVEPKLLPLPSSGKKRIGLVWRGSPTHERDRERSLPLAQLAPLWQKIPAQFYAPFMGRGVEEITPDLPIIRLDYLIVDFADMASLLAQLDCLITVDTAVAHLAGALGVRIFLLLPFCPDWRWGMSGTTTPWYASMTLFRQPSYGDWGSVIERVVEAIAAL